MTLPAMIWREASNVAGGRDGPRSAAAQALADVVVGVALEAQGDPGRHERAERLARPSR